MATKKQVKRTKAGKKVSGKGVVKTMPKTASKMMASQIVARKKVVRKARPVGRRSPVQKATFTITMNLPVKFEEGENPEIIIASCPLLDVWTQGRGLEEAKKNIAEALNLFVISCLERGTLEAVLKECGFAPDQRKAPKRAPPLEEPPAYDEYIDVQIPYTSSDPKNRTPCPV